MKGENYRTLQGRRLLTSSAVYSAPPLLGRDGMSTIPVPLRLPVGKHTLPLLIGHSVSTPVVPHLGL